MVLARVGKNRGCSQSDVLHGDRSKRSLWPGRGVDLALSLDRLLVSKQVVQEERKSKQVVRDSCTDGVLLDGSTLF